MNAELNSTSTERETPAEAAQTVFDLIDKEGYTIDEKITIGRKLSALVRNQIDTEIATLQSLRTSF